MLQEFKFADVGEGIAEAEIVRWLFKEGDIIKVGDVLTTVEGGGKEPAPVEAQKGDSGTVVGSLGGDEVVEVVRPVQAMPAVRALAKQMQIDLASVKGTGPGGRITKEDVEKAAKGAQQTDAEADPYGLVEKVPLRGIRRTIAKRMAEASKRVAEVTIWEDADITDLEQVRAKEQKIAEEKGVKLTYLPFLIKAVIPALKAHPYFNASLDEAAEAIILKKYFNIGIAVDTSDGLIVFVIKNADEKNILELASEIATLAEKARLRKIDLHELKGSTFTVTNYGVVGASYGTPIINYPEVAIVGLGKIEDRPVVRNGEIVIRKIMPLSLAFDHRVIDGVEAGRFLGVVIQHLEDPNLMLIEGK